MLSLSPTYFSSRQSLHLLIHYILARRQIDLFLHNERNYVSNKINIMRLKMVMSDFTLYAYALINHPRTHSTRSYNLTCIQYTAHVALLIGSPLGFGASFRDTIAHPAHPSCWLHRRTYRSQTDATTEA